MERARGTFVRSLSLPFMADASQVQASFKDGILSITIPKPREARERVQRIEVKPDGSGNGSQAGGNQDGGNQRASSGSQSTAEKKMSETAAE